MKYAVISDIHGNYPALKAVLNDAQKNGADRLLFLGDYFLDFPYPNEVAETLRNLDNAYIVRGNKEDYITAVNGGKFGRGYEQMNSLYWNYDTLTPKNRKYLSELSDEIRLSGDSGELIRMFHASKKVFDGTNVMKMGSGRFYYKMKEKPFTHKEYLSYINNLFSSCENLHSLLGGLPEGAYLFGHTHVQWHWQLNGKLLLNPGSCGLPLDFDTRASYSIIEYCGGEWRVNELRVDYDISETANALKNSPLYTAARTWCNVIIEELMTGEERISFLLGIAEKIAEDTDRPGLPFQNSVWRMAYDMYKNQKY